MSVHKDHQTYLGFSWKFQNTTKYFKFSALPFGLSTAAHVFSKVLRPVVKHWRSQGLRVILYLDDGWGVESNAQSCKVLSNILQLDLKSAGFFVNQEKSVWKPTQKLTWLGFEWDLHNSSLDLPIDKIFRFKKDIDKLSCNSLSARQLARITGKIISFMPSLGNICRIMSRNMMMLVATSRFWEERIFLTLKAQQEINFWLNNCHTLPRKNLFQQTYLPDRIVYTDASSYACGGFIVETVHQVVHKMWSNIEASKSSTYRELKAVFITLSSLVQCFSNRLVKVYTDNQNVVRIIKAGSMNSKLQDIAIDIFNFCLKLSISLEVEWIPRNQNQIADIYSKIFDFDDWFVSDLYFNYFNKAWGPYTCDLFADSNNRNLANFYSPYWCPGTSGVDAFAQNWSEFNCWIVPPVKLISRSISHLFTCKGQGTLVIPKWTSSPFWPLLWSFNDQRFKYFVKDVIEYAKPKKFFQKGSDIDSIFVAEKLSFNILVLRLDFRS
ncbi:Hypothetical predicted protein [Mytilus galloprovincialis]|uniref:Reverse transcriptase domain-containing protein n=1 Tax=Mytilus galloprovincialis TaxID=29158 RepID=A0A8B6BXG2_MYTGA|nr:Hypothetical predicted protein [Mytilus galloprovincialis]